MNRFHPNWITPNWQAPLSVRAVSTTRSGIGSSLAPFHQFNLAEHVGDVPKTVQAHRAQLPFLNIHWLEQVHSAQAVQLPLKKQRVSSQTQGALPKADASFTFEKEVTCVVMTADCLPILLCDRQARWVAAIHAGWRGLAEGIIEQTLEQIEQAEPRLFQSQNVCAWLGPAIGPEHFEVGGDVVSAFSAYPHAFRQITPHQITSHQITSHQITSHKQEPEASLVESSAAEREIKYLGNLYQIATEKLQHVGVKMISGGEYCTYSDPEHFYSYRRDGKTGRMASLISLF